MFTKIFQNYKFLLTANFSGLEGGVGAEDHTQKDTRDFQKLVEDLGDTLDGEDLDELQAIQKRLQEGTEELHQQTHEALRDELQKSLSNGFQANNSEDFHAFQAAMKIVSPDFHIAGIDLATLHILVDSENISLVFKPKSQEIYIFKALPDDATNAGDSLIATMNNSGDIHKKSFGLPNLKSNDNEFNQDAISFASQTEVTSLVNGYTTPGENQKTAKVDSNSDVIITGTGPREPLEKREISANSRLENNEKLVNNVSYYLSQNLTEENREIASQALNLNLNNIDLKSARDMAQVYVYTKAFQEKHGLSIDGYAGQKTFAKIMEIHEEEQNDDNMQTQFQYESELESEGGGVKTINNDGKERETLATQRAREKDGDLTNEGLEGEKLEAEKAEAKMVSFLEENTLYKKTEDGAHMIGRITISYQNEEVLCFLYDSGIGYRFQFDSSFDKHTFNTHLKDAILNMQGRLKARKASEEAKEDAQRVEKKNMYVKESAIEQQEAYEDASGAVEAIYPRVEGKNSKELQALFAESFFLGENVEIPKFDTFDDFKASDFFRKYYDMGKETLKRGQGRVLGNRNHGVQKLQSIFILLGIMDESDLDTYISAAEGAEDTINAHGVFGNITHSKVGKFQENNRGLTQTYEVGDNMKEALYMKLFDGFHRQSLSTDIGETGATESIGKKAGEDTEEITRIKESFNNTDYDFYKRNLSKYFYEDNKNMMKEVLGIEGIPDLDDREEIVSLFVAITQFQENNDDLSNDGKLGKKTLGRIIDMYIVEKQNHDYEQKEYEKQIVMGFESEWGTEKESHLGEGYIEWEFTSRNQLIKIATRNYDGPIFNQNGEQVIFRLIEENDAGLSELSPISDEINKKYLAFHKSGTPSYRGEPETYSRNPDISDINAGFNTHNYAFLITRAGNVVQFHDAHNGYGALGYVAGKHYGEELNQKSIAIELTVRTSEEGGKYKQGTDGTEYTHLENTTQDQLIAAQKLASTFDLAMIDSLDPNFNEEGKIERTYKKDGETRWTHVDYFTDDEARFIGMGTRAKRQEMLSEDFQKTARTITGMENGELFRSNS